MVSLVCCASQGVGQGTAVSGMTGCMCRDVVGLEGGQWDSGAVGWLRLVGPAGAV